MTTNTDALYRRLEDKEYRDLFVEEHIHTGLAMQIRATRESQGLSQTELGKRSGMAQSRISEIENPDYEGMTLTTLQRIASALDVALVVRFAPFSDLVEWETSLSPQALAAKPFEQEIEERRVAAEEPKPENDFRSSTVPAARVAMYLPVHRPSASTTSSSQYELLKQPSKTAIRHRRP